MFFWILDHTWGTNVITYLFQRLDDICAVQNDPISDDGRTTNTTTDQRPASKRVSLYVVQYTLFQRNMALRLSLFGNESQTLAASTFPHWHQSTTCFKSSIQNNINYMLFINYTTCHMIFWWLFLVAHFTICSSEDIDAYNDGVKGNPSKGILAAAERGAVLDMIWGWV